MDVSIIIVTFNTLKMTRECIDSVFEMTKGVSFELILVDNASTDGSKEFFSKDSRIKYIYSDSNLGFGKGNNLGYKYASGKYIFLLNSDTLLLNNAVAEFYNYMESASKNVGCSGTVLLDYNHEIMHSYGKKQSVCYFFNSLLRFYHLSTKKLNRPKASENYPKRVFYITGADLFIRRSVIEDCGLFDPDFFMYYEETEMQNRYHNRGYESWVIDSPQILHYAGMSASKNKKKSILPFIRQLRSRYIYLRKTHSIFPRVLIYAIHLLMIPGLYFKTDSKTEIHEAKQIILSPFLRGDDKNAHSF